MRASMARALLGTATLVGSLVVIGSSSADAASAYPTPQQVAGYTAGTCLEGLTVDADCSGASVLALNWRLAGLAQTNAILAANPDLATDTTNCPASIYRKSVVISRVPRAAFVTRYVLPPGVTVTPSTLPVPAGFFALTIADSHNPPVYNDAYRLVDWLYNQQIHHHKAVAAGWVAPDYVLSASGYPKPVMAPGTAPLPPGGLSQWTSPVSVGAVRRLLIFDNTASKSDVTIPDGWLDPAAGHGVFIRSMGDSAFGLPAGTTRLIDVTDARGLLDEAGIARVMDSYTYQATDVANLSAGTYACVSQGQTVPPLMLADMVRQLQAQSVHLVAAAGNMGVTTPFYPAAYGVLRTPSWQPSGCPPGGVLVADLCMVDRSAAVTSVGSVQSLTGSLRLYHRYTGGQLPPLISEFSNRGPWVEAWADGEGIVSAYTDGPYRYCVNSGSVCDLGDGTNLALDLAPTSHLGPLALWSGTSFAAPQVAIWIAAGNPAP